jgi:hypothetical protein
VIVLPPSVYEALSGMLTEPYPVARTPEAAALSRELARRPGEPRTERDIWWRWVTTRNKPSPHDDLHPSNLAIRSRALRIRQVAARSAFAGIDRQVGRADG